MFGELHVLMAFGKYYRATGRKIFEVSSSACICLICAVAGEQRKPSLQHSQVALESYVTLQELVDWICGPLAIVWRPYCLISSAAVASTCGSVRSSCKASDSSGAF